MRSREGEERVGTEIVFQSSGNREKLDAAHLSRLGLGREQQ